MPKNTRGGKGYKKMKKQVTPNDVVRKIILAENTEEVSQTYGMVVKRLGGKRVELLCFDEVTRKAVIPGKMIKKVWLNPNDIVLCSLGSLGNQNECYVEHKYNSHDIGVLSRDYNINFAGSLGLGGENDCNFYVPKGKEQERISYDIYAELDIMSEEYSD